MKFLKMGAILIASLLTSNAFAVDGYKEFKFGMTKADVKKAFKCNWYKEPSPDMDILACDKYPFSKKNTGIGLFFIDEKLERLALVIPGPIGNETGIIQGLMEKYKLSTPADLHKLQNPQPNDVIDAKWDNDTVIFRYIFDNLMNITMLLMYSSPDFDEKLIKSQKESSKSDL